MSGKLTLGDQVVFLDRVAPALQQLSYVKRAMPKADRGARLALHPFIVIRSGAAQGRMEKLMGAARNVDHDGQPIPAGTLHKLGTDLPGRVFIETRELKLLFFLKQLIQ